MASSAAAAGETEICTKWEAGTGLRVQGLKVVMPKQLIPEPEPRWNNCKVSGLKIDCGPAEPLA